MRNRKQNILFVTGNDDTYRKMLLESQGYSVTPVPAGEALSTLQQKEFHLLLVANEPRLEDERTFCKEVRTHHPNLRIGVVIERGEHIPLEACADVIIRAQYSPAAFLGAINTVLTNGDTE